VDLGVQKLRFLYSHAVRHTEAGRTSLNEESAVRRTLYLTTHNIHKRQTSMPPAGFEPVIPAGDLSHTLALDRSSTN
jgi:hypothetical protein